MQSFLWKTNTHNIQLGIIFTWWWFLCYCFVKRLVFFNRETGFHSQRWLVWITTSTYFECTGFYQHWQCDHTMQSEYLRNFATGLKRYLLLKQAILTGRNSKSNLSNPGKLSQYINSRFGIKKPTFYWTHYRVVNWVKERFSPPLIVPDKAPGSLSVSSHLR